MSINSSLNAGIMGLNVNSSKLATISDNISNSGTKGYKRADIEFSSLVLTERATTYDAGGVRANPMRHVDQRGAIISTRNVTDLAIGGAGFLPVVDSNRVGVDTTPSLKLVTTGSFRPDSNGYLTTKSGFTLMGWQADANGVVTVPGRESVTALEPVRVENLALAADPTTEAAIKVNLPQTATTAGVAFSERMPIEYFDNLGGPQTLYADFATTGAPANTWTFNVYDSAAADYVDDANPGTAVYTATLGFSAGAGTGGQLRDVNVGGTSRPAADLDLTDPASVADWDAYAAATDFDFETGDVTIAVNGTDFKLNIGALDSTSGVMQLASDFTILDVTKNGAPAATLTGIEVDGGGMLNAIFDTGFRRTLFQIPVANVRNPVGLQSLDGQAFGTTFESGTLFFYDAGTGPVGKVVSSALEESTTDIAEELTQLIKTQRAYSSNAKIIQTADEMLQETTNLKR